MASFCHQCGTALPPDARFCPNCGAAISAPQINSSLPLVRPRVGRQIAGICLAFSRKYGWDVSVVRIVTILVLLFSSGLFGIAYLAAWVTIPEEPLGTPNAIPPSA